MKITDTVLPKTQDEIEQQHRDWIMAKHTLSHQEKTISELSNKFQELQRDYQLKAKKNDDLETRLKTFQKDYEQLIDRSIAEGEASGNPDVSGLCDLKLQLEAMYLNKENGYKSEVEHLSAQLSNKDKENTKLLVSIQDLQDENGMLKSSLESTRRAMVSEEGIAAEVAKSSEEFEAMRKTMGQQLSEFDTMKKKLMKDLQNRCERVVELEIALEETKQQYNNVLKNNNTKSQQQKMAFLERNLEQLTNVQKQLVEQNATLKKDLTVADRKLCMRNERIQALENMLEETQAKLDSQSQKYETQLSSLQEKLQELRERQPDAANSSWVNSHRVAKPLRGGKAQAVSGEDDAVGQPSSPFVETQSSMPTTPLSSKRSSWYINLLKK